MSQSSKCLREIGSLSIKKSLHLKTGDVSRVNVHVSPAAVTLADTNGTLSVSQLKSTDTFVCTPTATRTITLPTATLLSSFLKSEGDSICLNFINLGADTFHLTIAAGTGGTLVGLAAVKDSDPTTASSSGSGTFKLRMTAVGVTPTYSLYRIV